MIVPFTIHKTETLRIQMDFGTEVVITHLCTIVFDVMTELEFGMKYYNTIDEPLKMNTKDFNSTK